jgi:hypothetical protein
MTPVAPGWPRPPGADNVIEWRAMSVLGPSRQAAFVAPTVANGAIAEWLDLQLAPPGRD